MKFKSKQNNIFALISVCNNIHYIIEFVIHQQNKEQKNKKHIQSLITHKISSKTYNI